MKFSSQALICVLMLVGGILSGQERVAVSGVVKRAGKSDPITRGRVEVRWPGHEDTFAPLEVPIREDGSYRICVEIPRDESKVLRELTLSAVAPGFLLSEFPLFRDGRRPGAGTIETDIELRASTVNGVLDIFSCCVLSLGIVTVMLPAFLLGAAVTSFVPSHQVLKWFGPTAPKPVAYGAAVGSGMVLSLCSCNVVPLFLSIWRSGAGIGPAFAFLYAGPAINLVAIVFTCRVIGFGIGIFRVLAVAVISVVVGLIMARAFGGRKGAEAVTPPPMLTVGPSFRVVAGLISLLLYLLVVGSLELTLGWRLGLTLPGVCAAVAVAHFCLGRDRTILWLRETWSLLMKVIPILIPAVLVIGFIAQKVPLHSVSWLTGSNSMGCNALAAMTGALMYFPILTETAFVKTMLKVMGMGIGPGIALLLTAPGLSLPGMIIVGRDIGLRKLSVYVVSITLMAMVTGWFFGSEWGAYICNCLME